MLNWQWLFTSPYPLKHPLLLEGAAGVGKTEDAKMQCGELLKEQGLTAGDEQDGVVNANKMYPSRGSMDIFIEPVLSDSEL